jgi:hypothetical protein
MSAGGKIQQQRFDKCREPTITKSNEQMNNKKFPNENLAKAVTDMFNMNRVYIAVYSNYLHNKVALNTDAAIDGRQLQQPHTGSSQKPEDANCLLIRLAA